MENISFKRIIIILFFSIFLVGCTNIEEDIENYPNTNEEIKKCMKKTFDYRGSEMLYQQGNPYIVLGMLYDECRFLTKKENFTNNKISFTCEELKSFIDINTYPKIIKTCYDEMRTDLLENKSSIKKNICPSNNIFKEKDFKEKYLNDCLLQNINNTK